MVVEAIALALPVITTDHHSVADIIDDSCDVKLPINSSHAFVADLSALLHTARERGEAESISHGLLSRGHEFSPDVQMLHVSAFIGDVVAVGNAHGSEKVLQP